MANRSTAPGATPFTLDRFRYNGGSSGKDTFADGHGFGPFTLQRRRLRNEILRHASPDCSIHINGCMGAGKTTLLKLLGNDLVGEKKEVYLFRSSKDIDLVRIDIETLIEKGKEAYFLIDETQANVDSAVFVYLLKNDIGHQITTIGAGVPAFESISSSFTEKISTDRLFVSEEELVSEGVMVYFSGDVTDLTIRTHIEKLLISIRSYVGGHVFPLMRLAELLVPEVIQKGKTADEAIILLNSSAFRATREFLHLSSRISPSMQDVDIRAIFEPQRNHLNPMMTELKRRGFCDQSGKVVSMLLVDLYLSSIGKESSTTITTLSAGVTGVQQILSWGAPRMDWSHYDAHGGPVEDALTFELLRGLSIVDSIGVMLFNPKLVTAGTASRRPDIYFDSIVHCYVQCVLTKSNTSSAREDVEKHVLRFFPDGNNLVAHYEIQGAAFAILHYQDWGTSPMQLQNEACKQCFGERVFTFLMETKELYLGNTRISGP